MSEGRPLPTEDELAAIREGVRAVVSKFGDDYWLQRDEAWKDFVDQWLHILREDGSFAKIYAAWFE